MHIGTESFLQTILFMDPAWTNFLVSAAYNYQDPPAGDDVNDHVRLA